VTREESCTDSGRGSRVHHESSANLARAVCTANVRGNDTSPSFRGAIGDGQIRELREKWDIVAHLCASRGNRDRRRDFAAYLCGRVIRPASTRSRK
jgi:hypothetical protein